MSNTLDPAKLSTFNWKLFSITYMNGDEINQTKIKTGNSYHHNGQGILETCIPAAKNRGLAAERDFI